MAKKGGRKDEEKEDEQPSEEEETDSSAEGSSAEESDEDEDQDEDEDESTDEAEDEDASEEEEDASEEEDESEEEDQSPPKAAKSDDDEPVSSKRAEDEEEEGDGDSDADEDEILPAQLGAQRYVYSAFFAATILFGYILGRAFETTWERLAISDWAVDKMPLITGVTDDSKQTYSFLVAGVIAILVAIRQFRKEAVRKWAEEVSGELLKVKWPSRKEVYSATIVVLATSGVAVTYLFLLDRFFSFVTNLIYGSAT